MLQSETNVEIADNTGAKKGSVITILEKGKQYGEVGDIVTIAIKESTPDATVKKGTVAKAVIVRTKRATRRDDGTYIRFDNNAVVIIDNNNNPRGTRVFGTIARELRHKGFMKIISLAPEVM